MSDLVDATAASTKADGVCLSRFLQGMLLHSNIVNKEGKRFCLKHYKWLRFGEGTRLGNGKEIFGIYVSSQRAGNP